MLCIMCTDIFPFCVVPIWSTGRVKNLLPLFYSRLVTHTLYHQTDTHLADQDTTKRDENPWIASERTMKRKAVGVFSSSSSSSRQPRRNDHHIRPPRPPGQGRGQGQGHGHGPPDTDKHKRRRTD
jgi:hypothetical protein